MTLRTALERCAPALVAALLMAGPAAALQITFDGPSRDGVSAATAAAVNAAGYMTISGSEVVPAKDFDLVIPAPKVLSSHLVKKSQVSVSNPNTAQSRWKVTNGDTALDDAWLVFFTPLTYNAKKVGIDLQPNWALVQVSDGTSDFFYPAVFLGDVAADATINFLMNHVVGVPLKKRGSTFVLPKYSVGVLEGVPVPEPATLALLAGGLALCAALRRGKA